MDDEALRDMFAQFERMEDPCVERTRRHDFHDIVVIGLLSVIGGADGFTDMQTFGEAKRQWLETFLNLSNGIPSHDTFGRVFAMLDADEFEQCLLAWTEALAMASGGKRIAMRWDTRRRSPNRSWSRAEITCFR